ncbi:methyltransferase domain-containing protein [Thermotoga sp. 38H-to]|uniref:methyltransferase domain-containing protein n=1 Tax=Thermotoga sp. 38H-to TaxID=1755812 RepID=UPI0013EAA04A|nr:methyltransferase domain-containing protein [Thermotoga sp. 38H-to]KAF2959939.1 D-alanine--D-alanine ligase [Thermotoga sp. 38H-to]
MKSSGSSQRRNQKRLRKFLGPVTNLEEHVEPDWWSRIFNSLYLKTDADVVDDINITREEVDLFSHILKLSPEDHILDLCCGHGRHSLELARRGFQKVEGLDRSHYLIQKAKAQAKKEGLNVKFREGDARKLPYPPDTFDVVLILGNSFGYFESVEDDLRILREVFRVLKPWGRILIDVANGEYLKNNFQPRSWEWIDKKHFVCRERSLSVDGKRLISREVVVNAEKGVIADQFYAERLYTPEELEHLLKTAGFSNVKFHGELSPSSQRNQDLGMMERRIIVTAVAKKEWTPIKKRPEKAVKNVVVVLGDPRKPDPLKPNSVFDEDDIYTIDQMKAALKSLKGYHFSYLDNHDTLITDLMKLRGKIDYVFNLCDEGFNNDPRKEAHVPALLEMLGIPYTGSGPQTLVLCYDKSLIRGIAREMGIPVPRAVFIKPEDTTFEIPFPFPAIVKPNFGDSSFGITQRSVVYSPEELINAVSEIRDRFGYDKPILVEEFLTGKDLSVGIIGNPPESYVVLPIIEEDYSALPPELPRICGYEAKWLPDSPYWNIKSVPAQLPEETEKFIIECCLKLFERLECRDYCRFDWRLDAEGNPKLLEVNPNPGWCWDGHLAKMAKIAGMSYAEMLGAILKAAEERLNIR